MSVKRTKGLNVLLVCLFTLISGLAGAGTLERVRESNTFNLGYLPNFGPFSLQSGDNATGFAIELCLKIADKVKTELGLPVLQVRFQPVTTTDGIDAVSSGKVDILCTPMPPTLERRKQVSFSVPIYTAGLSVVVRQNAPDALLNVLNGKVAQTGPTWRATLNHGLANQTFAAIAGGVTEAWIRQQMRLLGVVATLITVDNAEEGLERVAEGKADAFFGERMVLKNLLDHNDSAGTLRLLDRVFEYAPAAMAVDRTDEDFRLLVDTVLSDLYRTGGIEQAYVNYLGGISKTDKKLFRIYAIP
jgi:polar amino acid transport system substrate-binding protein